MTKYNLSYTLTYIKEYNRVYNWLNGEYVEFDDTTHPFLNIIKNNSNNFDKFKYQDSYDDFDWLLENKFIVKEQKEIQDIIRNKAIDINSDKYLQLTLLPAGMACNFACAYCYEDREQKEKMTKIHQELLLNYISSINSLEALRIDWFGGEPLMNKNFIVDFSQAVLSLSKKKGITYYSSMTTNGYYLTKDTFLSLLNCNIKAYQITIDGLENDHNKLRPLSNGQPTYKKIIENLSTISEIDNEDFSIVIRVNFNENSDVDGFLNSITTTKFAKDKRFSFIFRAIQNNWNNVENLVSCTKQPSALQDLYDAKAKEKGLIKGDYMLYMDIGTYSCYASRENSLIIYPDMSIRKCTVALDDERNKVGFINDKAKLVKNSNWNLWTLNKHSIHNKQECQTCSFNPQCLSSACPLKFIDTGEIICPHEVYNLENLSNNIIDYIENK